MTLPPGAVDGRRGWKLGVTRVIVEQNARAALHLAGGAAQGVLDDEDPRQQYLAI